MKTDLDALMRDQNIDALLVTGPGQHNPAMYYFTGGGHLTSAILIKLRGHDPILFYNSMERDEAASIASRNGVTTRSLEDYRFIELLKQMNGDILKASVARLQHMLEDLDLTAGRMAIYGRTEAGSAYGTFSALQEAMPGLTIVGEVSNSLILQAMATKDEQEIARIRKMGQITTSVVDQVADLLTSLPNREGVLVKTGGLPLTVGDVKSRINLWLAERGADNPEGTIFAIGRDAGVPHSTGSSSDPIRLGQTIVFDIFPNEAGGGYFYDFTRTWCLGYAADEAYQLYEDVKAVYDQVMSELRLEGLCREYQQRACELFEARGHPTVQSNPQTEEGYVHGLGHGLGLHVHELPWFGLTATEADRLSAGVVVTIEPGLYYPDRGLGMRLENTVWARPDGQMEVLADYPMDLVLPLRKA